MHVGLYFLHDIILNKTLVQIVLRTQYPKHTKKLLFWGILICIPIIVVFKTFQLILYLRYKIKNIIIIVIQKST